MEPGEQNANDQENDDHEKCCEGCGILHPFEGCPVVPLVRVARPFIARSEWIFAKTMAENPHWYVVLFHQQSAEDKAGYYALRDLIARHGWDRRWHGSKWRTYSLDGFDYWTIHPVINRKPEETAGWDDENQGRLF